VLDVVEWVNAREQAELALDVGQVHRQVGKRDHGHGSHKPTRAQQTQHDHQAQLREQHVWGQLVAADDHPVEGQHDRDRDALPPGRPGTGVIG